MFAASGPLVGAAALPIAMKLVGELHHVTVLQSNVLARQGLGTPSAGGDAEKTSGQRAAGVGGAGLPKSDPQYMGRVPDRALAGDSRRGYKVGGLGNATSSRGNLTDVLSKVPTQSHGGSGDYKRANRPTPRRSAGFGNQSYTP